MRCARLSHTVLSFIVCLSSRLLPAQTEAVSRHAGLSEVYGGYTYLSNSFNSHSGFNGPGLNGWDAALKLPLTRNASRFGIKVAGFGYYGSSFGISEQTEFLMGGGQYSVPFGRETVFVHALAGMGHINAGALTLGGEGPSSTFTFAANGGGGLDTPIGRRLAWRIEGDLLHSNFSAASNQIHGVPNFFARASTGVVWHF